MDLHWWTLQQASKRLCWVIINRNIPWPNWFINLCIRFFIHQQRVSAIDLKNKDCFWHSIYICVCVCLFQTLADLKYCSRTYIHMYMYIYPAAHGALFLFFFLFCRLHVVGAPFILLFFFFNFAGCAWWTFDVPHRITILSLSLYIIVQLFLNFKQFRFSDDLNVKI